MASTAAEIDPRLIAFMLPSIPESVRTARFHVRAALGFYGLGQYADHAANITSELVANVVKHVHCDVAETIGVTLARAWNQDAVIEPFSSCVCLADVQYVNGLGELASAPGAASELAEDAPGLELGVRALAG